MTDHLTNTPQNNSDNIFEYVKAEIGEDIYPLLTSDEIGYVYDCISKSKDHSVKILEIMSIYSKNPTQVEDKLIDLAKNKRITGLLELSRSIFNGCTKDEQKSLFDEISPVRYKLSNQLGEVNRLAKRAMRRNNIGFDYGFSSDEVTHVNTDLQTLNYILFEILNELYDLVNKE